MKRKPHRYILYLLLRVALAWVRLLPRDFCLSLARFIGGMVYKFLGRYRTKTIAHLKSAFCDSKTDAELESIARDVFVNLALNAVDWCKWNQLSEQEKENLIVGDPGDIEKLRALYREGRGLIFLA